MHTNSQSLPFLSTLSYPSSIIPLPVKQGEVEADMALSKWFLCGSGGAAASGPTPSGGFEKDEPQALLFTEKAANRGLSSAQFAMGYYAEIGVGQPRSLSIPPSTATHSHLSEETLTLLRG